MLPSKKSKLPNSISIVFFRLFAFLFFATALILFYDIFKDKQSRIENAILNSKRVELVLSPFDQPNEVILDKKKDPNFSSNEFVNEDKRDNFDADGVFVGLSVDLPIENDPVDTNSNISNTEYPEINWSNISDRPAIILIIKDVGLNFNNSQDVLSLPSQVNIGFSPYSQSLQQLQKMALGKNHNILMRLPLESPNPNIDNIGPYGLTTNISDSDNYNRASKIIELLGEGDFIYSDQGEVFTQNVANSSSLIRQLKENGKYLVYGNGVNNMIFNESANILNFPVIPSELSIDNNLEYSAILKKLNEAEKKARKKGFVIVTAGAYPITINILKKWITTLQDKNIELLPISRITSKDKND